MGNYRCEIKLKNKSCWTCKHKALFARACKHPKALVYTDKEGKKYFRSTYLERQEWSYCNKEGINHEPSLLCKLQELLTFSKK